MGRATSRLPSPRQLHMRSLRSAWRQYGGPHSAQEEGRRRRSAKFEIKAPLVPFARISIEWRTLGQHLRKLGPKLGISAIAQFEKTRPQNWSRLEARLEQPRHLKCRRFDPICPNLSVSRLFGVHRGVGIASDTRPKTVHCGNGRQLSVERPRSTGPNSEFGRSVNPIYAMSA